MVDTQELFNLKEKIEEGKVKLNKLEGQKEGVLKNLKEEFGCKGLKNAIPKLNKMEEEVEKEEVALDKQIEQLSRRINSS